MRCGRAQALMVTAADGELEPRGRHALERHVTDCPACRDELARTERLLGALARLPMEAPVRDGLEQATIRRVRRLAAEESEGAGPRWWHRWLSLPVFAVASVAALVLAIGLATQTSDLPVPPVGGHAVPKTSVRIARREVRRSEPPPALAQAPDLYMSLPILKNLEKLELFEAIQTTTLDDETPSGEEQSNG